MNDPDIDTNIYETIEDIYELTAVANVDHIRSRCISKLGKQLEAEIESLSADINDTLHKGYNPTREELETILVRLSGKSCAVGGCVRDALLGKTPKDFDYVTDADYDMIATEFKYYGWTVKETGKQFRVMIVSKDSQDFEIANFRKDSTYVDGRRPLSTDIGTIQDDASRRDFTINALYFNIKSQKLIDPTGQGISDIKTKTLRFIGSAKDRIEDDYLRVFRFYRFLKTKGLIAHPESLRTVRTMFEKAVKNTDATRIMVEIERM